jgi:alpha-tubulin suppressor-like RCC1 family protein
VRRGSSCTLAGGGGRSTRWLLAAVLLSAGGVALGAAVSAPPASGAVLVVRISGLPSGVPARVTVRGPDAYVRRLRYSRTLRRLKAGRYRTGAASVRLAEFRYAATVDRPSLRLRRWQRASVRVRYTLVSPSGDAAGISAGGIHSCAVTTGGAVKCWGYNASGQLGAVTDSWRSSTPVSVGGLTTGISAISAGGGHSCALTSGGAPLCWGANEYGQVGDGTVEDTFDPTPVSGLTSGVAAISAGGGWHTCAVTTAGGALCWGLGSNGQLGDGSDTYGLTPVGVSGLSSGVRAISAGRWHTCAVSTAGGALCWGANLWGQLGDGTGIDRLTPVPVAGLSSGVIAISAGDTFTCALTSLGGVRCWGANDYGQLGSGSVSPPQVTPVGVRGLSSGVAALSAGREHACAVTTAGAAKCWGRGDWGQLGDWRGKTTPTPVSVAFLSSGITAIDAGGLHSCAVTSTGGALCWGDNGNGELGNGWMSGGGATTTPYPVVGFGA